MKKIICNYCKKPNYIIKKSVGNELWTEDHQNLEK